MPEADFGHAKCVKPSVISFSKFYTYIQQPFYLKGTFFEQSNFFYWMYTTEQKLYLRVKSTFKFKNIVNARSDLWMSKLVWI